MTAIIWLLAFILGFLLGKRQNTRTGKKPSRKCEVFDMSDFLHYDGSEQS